MEDPQGTLELLDKLVGLGFDDEAFWRVHHWREKGDRETIRHHADYCRGRSSFRTEANPLVQRRLRLVLDAYRKGGFSSRRPEVFTYLAEAAYAELPPEGNPT